MLRRQWRASGKRGVKVGIGHLDQTLQLIELIAGQMRNLGIGKSAEDKVHLAGAAMPAAKQQPLAAIVKTAA